MKLNLIPISPIAMLMQSSGIFAKLIPNFSPGGWERFSLTICKNEDSEKKSGLDGDWNIMYHGADGENVDSILASGQFAIKDKGVTVLDASPRSACPRCVGVVRNPNTSLWTQMGLEFRVNPNTTQAGPQPEAFYARSAPSEPVEYLHGQDIVGEDSRRKVMVSAGIQILRGIHLEAFHTSLSFTLRTVQPDWRPRVPLEHPV